MRRLVCVLVGHRWDADTFGVYCVRCGEPDRDEEVYGD
jgi:hypothetical protein